MTDLCPGFTSIASAADLSVMRQLAGLGPHHAAIVDWLRGIDGVRTLAEIAGVFEVPRPEIAAVLDHLVRLGVIEVRDMVTDAGSEPVWWAWRLPLPDLPASLAASLAGAFQEDQP